MRMNFWRICRKRTKRQNNKGAKLKLNRETKRDRIKYLEALVVAQEYDLRMLFEHNVRLLKEFKSVIDDERVKLALPERMAELNTLVDKMLGRSEPQIEEEKLT